jgi:hypothetical protein
MTCPDLSGASPAITRVFAEKTAYNKGSYKIYLNKN